MKKFSVLAFSALALWDLFYIFVLCSSVVTEYINDEFIYWGYPQWGSMYESPKAFLAYNVVYFLILLAIVAWAFMWRANVKKAMIPVALIAVLSLFNMYAPNYNRSHQFKVYTAEDGTDMSRIPAGKWLVSNQMMESYDEQSFMMKAKGWFGRGEWPGNSALWGEYRIWLVPGPNTSNEGRRGLVLHGGKKEGSPWGVNMGKDITDFANKLKEIPTPLELNVEY